MLQCGISMNSDLQIVQSNISPHAMLLLSRLKHEAACQLTASQVARSATFFIRLRRGRRHREPVKISMLVSRISVAATYPLLKVVRYCLVRDPKFLGRLF
jgi:hypothetical protein